MIVLWIVRVLDCPLNFLTSDQNCFGVGFCRFEDSVLDFKCSVLSCSHVKCSSEVVNPSVWLFVPSGILRTWNCSYLGNLIALGMFWLVLVGNVAQLPELHPVRQQSAHTALSTVQRLWHVRTSPCAPQPTLAEGAGGCATLCPCRQCPLAQCCLSAPPCFSLSHGARASCTLWSSLPVLTLFSSFPISDPTQLSLCPYRWLLLTWILNLALNFSFWTHP